MPETRSYKTGALPLSYPGNNGDTTIDIRTTRPVSMLYGAVLGATRMPEFPNCLVIGALVDIHM